MTEEPTYFQHEHAIDPEEELLDNLRRLPEYLREAVALLVRDMAEKYRNYQ